MEAEESKDDNTSNSNMQGIQNYPCDENHEMKDNETLKDNSNDNYVSPKGDADDDKKNNQKPQQSSAGSKKKTSTLKRKKLSSSHLAHTSLKNAVSLSTSAIVTDSSAIHDDLKGERETRQKKKITKQYMVPKGDILQQKYQELHQLLVLPLVQPVSRNVLKIGDLLHLQDFNQESDSELSHGRVSDTYGDYHDSKKLKSINRSLQQETRWKSQSSTDVGYSQWVRQNKSKPQINRPTTDEKILEKENQAKKHMFQPSDTFLKNTNNPSIKQWLKKKEREIRKRKREERKKAKEERLKKQEQETLKQEKFKDSELRVREWMLLKRKEAVTKTKESKQLEKDEIKDANCDTARGLPLPDGSEAITTLSSGADAQGVSHLNIELKEQAVQTTPSSFVYARPVSGRVRLIKLQQLSKENAKKKELEKQLFKKNLEKEKTKKMRVSYDQWLLKKREDDYAKRQEAARMRALAKSDSELHNAGVTNARKRVKSFNRSKKIIDGNDSEPEKTLDNDSASPLTGLQKIKVLGSKKNLNVRPSSARSSLSPRLSKAFHRPLSANPDAKNLDSRIAQDGVSKKPFTVPFPPESGAPKYVLDKQRKLISPRLTQASDVEKSNVRSLHDGENVIDEKSDFNVNQTKEDFNQQSTALIELQVTKQVEVNEIKSNPVKRNVKQVRNEIKAKRENVEILQLKGNSSKNLIADTTIAKENSSTLIADTTIAKELPHLDEINNNSNKVMTNKHDKGNSSTFIADTTIAKELPHLDDINNNSNKVMTNKHDKENFNILKQIIHADAPGAYTDSHVVALEPVESPETVLPDGNSSINSSVSKEDESEDYSSDSSSEDVEEISYVNDSPRRQEEISDVNDSPKQQEEISGVSDSPRQQEEISGMNDSPRQQEEISDVNDLTRQKEEISGMNDSPRQQEEMSDVNDSPRPQEEITDSSITRNSVKHVSFQESPVVFESSDTEIHSDSSEANEIEEDLPDEDDEF